MKPIDKLSQVDDKLLDPTQLTFRLKGPIRKRIQSVLDKEDGDEETREELARLVDSDKQMLSYESLSEIHKRIQRLDPTYNMYFFELLDECRALVPNERQNKELDSRLKKLQFEASGRQYNKMASSVSSAKPGGAASMNISAEVREIRPILITLINSILVVGGTFFFVFKAVEYSMTEPDVVIQVLASLIVASIVALAELYFLIKII